MTKIMEIERGRKIREEKEMRTENEMLVMLHIKEKTGDIAV